MKLRDLLELLDEAARAQRDVDEAETAIGHGGNADTMERKHNWHRACLERLEEVLDQEIDFSREGT